MARKFKTVNYADSLQQTVTLGDCLALDHLARFIVGVIGLKFRVPNELNIS